APNLVRGRSHSDNIAAGELAERGLVDVLSSDYVPAAALHGAWALHVPHGMPLHQAMATVSAVPAERIGLDDRGELLPGRRADMIRVALHGEVPVVRSVWRAGGRVAGAPHRAGAGAARREPTSPPGSRTSAARWHWSASRAPRSTGSVTTPWSRTQMWRSKAGSPTRSRAPSRRTASSARKASSQGHADSTRRTCGCWIHLTARITSGAAFPASPSGSGPPAGAGRSRAPSMIHSPTSSFARRRARAPGATSVS